MSNTPRIRNAGKIINPRKRNEHSLKSKATRIHENRLSWGEDRTSHSMLIRKVPPPAVARLAQLLQQPQNKDIHDAGIKGKDFSECLGNIAAFLDIALDGQYDVPDLCNLLCRAIDSRGTLGNSPHKLDDRLVNAELVERENSFELVESALATGTIAPLPQEDMMRFMDEHDCLICENVSACKAAKKCLGAGAFEEGKPHA